MCFMHLLRYIHFCQGLLDKNLTFLVEFWIGVSGYITFIAHIADKQFELKVSHNWNLSGKHILEMLNVETRNSKIC